MLIVVIFVFGASFLNDARDLASTLNGSFLSINLITTGSVLIVNFSVIVVPLQRWKLDLASKATLLI